MRRPKLEGFIAIIEGWLEDDKKVLAKQRHTAKRIFNRLRDEHGFTGGYTIVKDYVREREQRNRDMFVPLAHPPGHAQADFGEAVAIIGGVEQKAHFFLMDLPHSDACFVRAYPAAIASATCAQNWLAAISPAAFWSDALELASSQASSPCSFTSSAAAVRTSAFLTMVIP